MTIRKVSTHSTSKTRSRNALALALMALLSAGGAFAATGSPVSIAHGMRLDPADAVIGPLPMNQPIHVEVALKLRDKEGLDAFVADIAKSDARHLRPQLMTSLQFLADHAPTQAQAQEVAGYLVRSGFTHVVIAPNRLLVFADGTAMAAQKAFMTNLVQVRTHDGRMAFANSDDVRIPEVLADVIVAVLGLQNVHEFHAALGSQAPAPKSSGSIAGRDVVNHEGTDYPWIYGAVDPVANQVPVGIVTEGDLSDVQIPLNAYASEAGMKPVVQSVVNTDGTSSDTTYSSHWLAGC